MTLRPCAALLAFAATAHAEPILTSWFTQNSGALARSIQSSTLTTPVTMWPASGVANNNTGGVAQTVPVYADIQRIRHTPTDVYINASGLASYTMGPWLSASGGLFGFWPLANDYQVRITRAPTQTTAKTKHPGGPIGMMVNGVVIYDLGDSFSFKQSNTTTPSTSAAVTGSDAMGFTAPWSRDALAVEVVTFDPGFAHQPGNNGQYHYHAQPKALRHQLGDNTKASYNAATNTYSYAEDTSNLHHSPILGWCYDGYPIYGPYGYSVASDPSSPVTRMRTGFQIRDGSRGTTNLATTGRVSLPRWAATAQGYANPSNLVSVPLAATEYGPTIDYKSTGPGAATYSLGRYIGDYEYLGDRGYLQGTDFDLDQYNGRQCVTPDFPGGTYAYFVAIDSLGSTTFPHMLSKEFYGVKNAGTSTSVPANAVDIFNGGPNLQETMRPPTVNSSSGTVTIAWNSVEGGTYKLEAADEPGGAWTVLNPAVPAAANTTRTAVTETSSGPKRFYRVTRTATAPYDPAFVGQ